MAVVTSGNVTQSADAATLQFNDTTTGLGTIVSRTLVIYDSNGVIVETINMGTNTTADQTISSDIYESFVETIFDNIGGPYTVTVNYPSIQFYNLAQSALSALLALPCNCNGVTCSSLVKARECINSALTAAAIGDGQTCQAQLDAADFYINNPTY